MVAVKIYDVKGKVYNARLINGVPSLKISNSKPFPIFLFSVRLTTSMYGSIFWVLNNKFHRVDGPAVEHAYGYKEWWANGKLHRLDGPAIEDPKHKIEEWWINDFPIDPKKYNEAVKDFLASGIEI